LVSHSILTHYKRKKITETIRLGGKMIDELIFNPFRRYSSRYKLNKLLAQHDAVVDFDCCFSAFLKNTKIRKVTFFHFSIESLFAQNHARMKRIAKRLGRYDKIVTISKQMSLEACNHFPSLSPKICFIYNAVNEDKIALKAAEPVDNPLINEPFLLAIERLEESQKDITTLLKAHKVLIEQYGHTEKLYIIGKGSSQKALEELVTQLGIEDSVSFLGFFSNPYPWIKRAKLMVHSAKFEGLPTVLIEALLLQKVIVATDCPTGPRELLDEGKAGILVPVGDEEKMAAAIHKLLSDENLQQHYLQHSSEHARTFTFQKTKPLFEELLR
ncbi:MAG: glycosyltransferase, partial [Phocaeicola sp.]